ncbi:MAG: type II toxin-antitoxin system prevent-host-death family antitoxin [Actinomycetia bacterium]|nr:type II toxin-antitoxin system prevent-host-death family antitoxin [Actinomycetes bacterium]
MVVTATELKQNLGKYLELANTEEITITKNGQPAAYLSGRLQRKYAALEHLSGYLADFNPTPEELAADHRLERILSR